MEANKKFMKKALKVAQKSGERGDYAIGAVVVKDGKIISIGKETLKSVNDPVNGHSEIDAIRKACKKLKQPYLEGCIIYSTHEPCPMCTSAAIWAKMEGVIFSVSREDMINEMRKRAEGNKFSWRQIDISCEYIIDKGEPKLKLIKGFMREEGLKLFYLTK